MPVPYHTHDFTVPTATQAQIEAGTSTSDVVTPGPLNSALPAITAAATVAATAKTTPVDADLVQIVDSEASNVNKKLTFANLGAWVWTKLGALIAGGTAKTTPVDADTFALSDSAATNATKKFSWANLKAALATVASTGAYSDLTGQPTLGTAAALDVGTTAGDVVQLNGSGQLPAVDGSLLTGISGSGDVVGPAGATDSNFAAFDTTTGKLLKDSTYSASSFATPASVIGKQPIWVPAGAMVPRTTNGAASGTAEMTTNKNMFATLDFDASTAEFAQFSIRMPSQWNEGTVTFVPVWSHASTTTNFGVVWTLAGVAISDDDAGDVAFGTAGSSTDTGGTTDDIYHGPEASAITIAGTPAAGDLVQFLVSRLVSDGSDTMAIDARLHGVTVYITQAAGVDA